MKFREFYNESRFELVKKGTSNWDYYKQITASGHESIVALAKPNTGAQDSFFGSQQYFDIANAKYTL